MGNYAWENPSQATECSVARQQLCSQLGCFDPHCTMKISVGVLLMGMVVMTPLRSHLHAQHPQLCVPTVGTAGVSPCLCTVCSGLAVHGNAGVQLAP